MRKTREQIEYQLSIKRNRLELYLKREAEMLDERPELRPRLAQSGPLQHRPRIHPGRHQTARGRHRSPRGRTERREAAKSCGSSAPRLVKEAPKGAFFIGRRREFSLLFSRPGHLHHEGGEHHQQKKKQKPPTKQAAAAAPRE